MSIRQIGSHLLTLAVIGGFAVLGAASSGSGDGSGSDEEGSSGAAARRALEGRLTNGRAYGEGPGGAAIATAMQVLLDTNMGDAVAVHVTPGPTEQIVVILRLSDLSEMSDTTREEWLDSFGQIVRMDFGAVDSNIVVGIRGNMFFGAVSTMRPGATTWDTQTGSIVSTTPLDEALSVAAIPSVTGRPPFDVYASIDPSDGEYSPPAEGDYQPDTRQADRYPLALEAGAQITVHMNAPDLDCYLYVLGPDQAVVAEDDDGGGQLNSRVDFTASAAGTYTVIATTFTEGDTGAYALRVRSGSPTP